MIDVPPSHPGQSCAVMREGKPGHDPGISFVDGWTLHEYSEVDSTNLVAARMEVWNAVRSDTQTGGRGRFQRKWVSDLGGMWLSAVVPIGNKPAPWNALPLMAALAVARALEREGISQLRMRWPNDLLVGEKKLAGLLIDKFAPGLAVVGIGLNVSNNPEAQSPELKNLTVRLSELVPVVPEPKEIAIKILRELRCVVTQMEKDDIDELFCGIAGLWRGARPVELDLDGVLCAGMFQGVRADGRLILADDAGAIREFEPWQVRHLKEI